MLLSALRTGILSLVVLTASISAGWATNCPQHYAGGEAPVLLNKKLETNAGEFCFSEFAVFYSGQTRTPLYAVEHLTTGRLDAARGDERKDTFHEEPRLRAEFRSTLDDYRRSGFDRGHLAPSADMTNPDAMHESFSLVNIVPQHPGNNRGVWADIERSVRQATYQVGEIYVVTGVSFVGDNLRSLKGRVLVPTHVWKAVFVPSRNMASAYITVNADDGDNWQEISIDQLAGFTGIDPFPSIPADVKKTLVDLPDPMPYRGRSSGPTKTGVDDVASKMIGGLLNKWGIQ